MLKFFDVISKVLIGELSYMRTDLVNTMAKVVLTMWSGELQCLV